MSYERKHPVITIRVQQIHAGTLNFYLIITIILMIQFEGLTRIHRMALRRQHDCLQASHADRSLAELDGSVNREKHLEEGAG